MDNMKQQQKLENLIDLTGCCNMGSPQYHQDIAEKFPKCIVKFANLEYAQYKTFNIRGMQGLLGLTPMIK